METQEGWDIAQFDEIDWVPWGSDGNARAKFMATADGYNLVLIEAEAGYQGNEQEHTYPEFLYVVEGTLRNQRKNMKAGDGYAAASGSRHTDFSTDSGATYLLVFKL